VQDQNEENNLQLLKRAQRRRYNQMISEMSRMSFEPTRYSIYQSISSDRKVIRYETKTTSEPIHEDELVKKYHYENML